MKQIKDPSTEDVVMAIDPDIEKSGVAILYLGDKLINVKNLSFHHLLEYISHTYHKSVADGCSIVIIVEAGYLNKASSWHIHGGDNSRIAAFKGESVGRNKQVGKLITEYCQHHGMNMIEQRPLKKIWGGRDKKITHEELNTLLTNAGINTIKRTNQETRDAVLLALNHAQIPLKF